MMPRIQEMRDRRTPVLTFQLLVSVLTLFLAACGTGEDGQDTTDATATPSGSPTPAPAQTSICEDAPVVTYANFGAGFMIENCQTCHATTSPDRHGAPPDVYYDTHDDVLRWRERILARATGAAPTMPPGGGVSSDDRLLLEIWLTCWE